MNIATVHVRTIKVVWIIFFAMDNSVNCFISYTCTIWKGGITMSEPYNDLKQVEMAIKSAERMIGHATMSMDEGQLQAATDALNQAKQQYQDALSHQTGVDDKFFEFSSEIIERMDTQLKEAKK